MDVRDHRDLNQLSSARGSLREIDTHLEFAYRLEYATAEAIRQARRLMDIDAAQLNRPIQSLRRTGNRH